MHEPTGEESPEQVADEYARLVQEAAGRQASTQAGLRLYKALQGLNAHLPPPELVSTEGFSLEFGENQYAQVSMKVRVVLPEGFLL
jgi:hypothetical protein